MAIISVLDDLTLYQQSVLKLYRGMAADLGYKLIIDGEHSVRTNPSSKLIFYS
jgi:hypothetical protein